MGYGVTGNTADSDSAILGSNPGTPASGQRFMPRPIRGSIPVMLWEDFKVLCWEPDKMKFGLFYCRGKRTFWCWQSSQL